MQLLHPREAAAVAALAQRDAEIVAWLRKGFDTYPHGTFARCREMQSYWDGAAEAIERGEYRRTGDVAGD